MKDLAKILLYLAATVLLGAAIAPPLFWAGRWAGAHLGIKVLIESDFPRYFNRAILIAALAWLWPLAKSLRIGAISNLGLRPDPHRSRNLAFGLFISLVVMTALVAVLLHRGIYRLRADAALTQLAPILLSAAGASVLEELLFRGALLGLLRRTLSSHAALFWVSALYSIVHFVKPRGTGAPPDTIHFLSGFALLPDVFWRFAEPGQVLSGFTTLFLLGWILGCAAIRTRALWLSIGIHAGCILGKYGCNRITKRSADWMPWIGGDLQTGIIPLLALGAMGLAVWAWVKFGENKTQPDA